MADSLVLAGVKDVKAHTGTEMLRLNPKGGGDTFQLKQWWVKGGASTCYVDATVFRVTTTAGVVKLALATSMSTNINIRHDGSFNFDFFFINEVNRAALFTDDFQLIEEYVFPRISGGKVMTVIPANGASRPSVDNAVAFSSQSTITGTAQVGEILQGTAAVYTGGVGDVSTNLIFQTSANGTTGWAFLDGNPDAASGAVINYTVPEAQEDQYIRVSYQVTDDDGIVSSNSSSTTQILAAAI